MLEPRKIFGGLGNRMFQGAYLLAQQAKGEIPDVYLQDEKYFAEIKDQIKELYRKERPYRKGEDATKQSHEEMKNYVSLHIRRGDYINNPFYVDLTKTDYYKKAIAQFPDEQFLLFYADRQGEDDKTDMLWCHNYIENELGLKRDQYATNMSGDEIGDFNRMMNCKAHIMANSSFSWWASYIGGGRTIAPSQWFSNGTRINYPSNWEIC